MGIIRHSWVAPLLLALMHGFRASAQTDQLLPEIDLYYGLQPGLRVDFQAKETREGGTPTSAEIGPSLDFYLKPLKKLIAVAAFDLDESKFRPLVLSVGYRYLPAPNGPPTNRMEPVVTVNFPVPKARMLLSDRNRADLDWKPGEFSWRYRNRVQLERPFRVRFYHLSPYASAEFFYESQYRKWSDTAVYFGCLFPISRHIRFNPYYEHQNNTGKTPNQRLNQLGLELDLYF